MGLYVPRLEDTHCCNHKVADMSHFTNKKIIMPEERSLDQEDCRVADITCNIKPIDSSEDLCTSCKAKEKS